MMRKLPEQICHPSSLIVDQQKSNLIRMKIHRQRQDVTLNQLRLPGAGGSCHQTVRTVRLLMQVQKQDIVLRPHPQRHRQRFVRLIPSPAILDIKFFWMPDPVHFKKGDLLWNMACNPLLMYQYAQISRHPFKVRIPVIIQPKPLLQVLPFFRQEHPFLRILKNQNRTGELRKAGPDITGIHCRYSQRLPVHMEIFHDPVIQYPGRLIDQKQIMRQIQRLLLSLLQTARPLLQDLIDTAQYKIP